MTDRAHRDGCPSEAGQIAQVDYLHGVADIPFRLGRPEDLPSSLAGLMSAARPTQKAARLLADADPSDLTELAAAADAARGVLEADYGETVADDPQESESNRHNDLAFGIVRCTGAPLPLMVDAALHALSGILDLTERIGTGLADEDWNDLLSGLATAVVWPSSANAGAPWERHTDGQPDSRPDARTRPPQLTGAARPDDALRRWVRGHHVFMVFAQCCATALRCLRSAAEQDEVDSAYAAARAATVLMKASRGALQYAGDSTNDEYVTEIRPTLMPPVAPPKMSGLHWRDHEALISALAAARDCWDTLSSVAPELVEEFRSALDTTYAAHRGVCRHFVGDSSPSLLATSQSQRSAVGVLTQFRDRRLGLMPPGRQSG
ncbi:hypothetical protein [Actinopolyspora saharensis]|uniref:hypothetical protein n=1 Tax=Actinopolyspora saharensis TaxID=995062 RepID=UPI003F661328